MSYPRKLLNPQLLIRLLTNQKQTPININRLNEQLQGCRLDQSTAVSLFQALSEHPHHKVYQIVKKISMEFEEESFILVLNRVSAGLHSGVIVDQEYKKLEQMLLLGNLAYEDLILLTSILDIVNPKDQASFSKLKKLIASSITDYLQLNTNIIHNDQLLYLYKQIRKYSLHSHHLQHNLNIRVQKQMHDFNQNQLNQLSMLDKVRSFEELKLLTVNEKHPLRKKILQTIMYPQKNVHLLDGKLWSDKNQLKQVFQFLAYQGRSCPFIDVLELHSQKQIQSSYTYLTEDCFDLWIHYYFSFVCHGYHKLSSQGFLNLLAYFQQQNSTEIELMLKDKKIQLFLKLLIVIDYAKRYQLVNTDKAQKCCQLEKIISRITVQKKENNLQLADFKQQAHFNILKSFLLLQLSDHLTQPNSPAFSIETISHLLNAASQGSENSSAELFSQENQILDYCKFLLNSPSKLASRRSSIIYSEGVSRIQFAEYIHSYIEHHNKFQTQPNEKTFRKIQKQFKIVKNAIVQPGIKCSYVISKTKGNEIQAVIDHHSTYSQYAVFDAQFPFSLKAKRLVKEPYDLNYAHLWKHYLFGAIFNLPYSYCLDEMEVGVKICQAINIDSFLN